jgi:hypothetical protein
MAIRTNRCLAAVGRLGDMEFDGPVLGVGIVVDDPCETGGKVAGGLTDS